MDIAIHYEDIEDDIYIIECTVRLLSKGARIKTMFGNNLLEHLQNQVEYAKKGFETLKVDPETYYNL